MHISVDTADFVLAPLVAAAAAGDGEFHEALAALNAPIYVTDAQGFVTYFTPACAGFTGRAPVVGRDRWCVTWRLFTDDGNYMPHDQCPMALAIRSGRPVRGVTAIAARPDGTRVRFTPFPTPLRGPTGQLIGAINILLDATDVRQPAELQSQADRCLGLAAVSRDPTTAKALLEMADEYEIRASELRDALARRKH